MIKWLTLGETILIKCKVKLIQINLPAGDILQNYPLMDFYLNWKLRVIHGRVKWLFIPPSNEA